MAMATHASLRRSTTGIYADTLEERGEVIPAFYYLVQHARGMWFASEHE